MLTGQVPFKGGGMGEVTHAILHDDPPLPLVKGPDAEILQAIIIRCMKKSPKNRYGSVAEILSDLGKIKG
jgi:eukaryotic-like serine/threonine-protein kinase